MKPKKLKSLSVRKVTVANLKPKQLSEVKGGACTYEWSGCDSIMRPCCTVGFPNTCTYPPMCPF
jgi:hypothetical protein